MSTTTYSQKKSVSSKAGGGKKSDRSRSKKSSKRMHPDISNVDSMEPDILLRILYGKGGLGTSGQAPKK